MKDEIGTIVILTTAKRLKLNPSTIHRSSSFFDDLGADSLGVVEIVMSLEERLGITVPDSDLEQLDTIGKLCDYLSQRIHKSPSEFIEDKTF